MQDDPAVLYPTKSDGRIWLKCIKTRPDRVPAPTCHLRAMEIPPAGAPLGAGFAVRQWLVGARDFWRVVPL